MNFKDIKAGFNLFILDKSTYEFQEKRVSSVSVPRLENKVGSMPQMVVDITVDNPAKTYVLPAESSKAYTDCLTLSTTKESVVTDIKVMQSAIEHELQEVPKKQEQLKKCKELLSELDTEYKERQQTEQRITGLEKRFDSFESMLKAIYNKQVNN